MFLRRDQTGCRFNGRIEVNRCNSDEADEWTSQVQRVMESGEKPRPVNLIGDVKGKRALIVDDEIASGGTLMEAAAFVLNRGAISVEAAAVHPVLSGAATSKIASSQLASLVVTDTLPLSPESASAKSRSARSRNCLLMRF
ncbi:phosphoribosyltransferase family protein [Mesorhizobium delmotii]|uniref:phosphoribosyltransferase family protein n=1 Tax=Mesorhizobium delmotii TaxID=1631247 RepID=UPI000F43C5E1|nr:phosphoribosyltransferase family protein [Mesorhizobium delmotii]